MLTSLEQRDEPDYRVPGCNLGRCTKVCEAPRRPRIHSAAELSRVLAKETSGS
jgi:hypothetical protein